MGCEKIRKYCILWSREVMSKVETLDRIKLGEGKEAVKTRPVNFYLTYIVILSSSDETRQGSLIPGTLFPLQLQKVTKCNLAKITLYRHESAVQKVGNAESSTF